MADPVRKLVGNQKKRVVENTEMEWTLSGLSREDLCRLANGLNKVWVELDEALCSQGCGPNVKRVTEELEAVQALLNLVEQGLQPPEKKS